MGKPDGLTPLLGYEDSDYVPVVSCIPKGASLLPRKPNLSRYLRNARIERGLSVAQLAERIGVSQASVYFWEGDRVRPRAANLSAICKVLKLPIRRTKEIAAS